MSQHWLRPSALLATLLMTAGPWGGASLVMGQNDAPSAPISRDVTRITFDGEAVPMSLRDVIELAFQQNLEIEIFRLESTVAEARAYGELGIYDPLLTAGVVQRSNETESSSVTTTGVRPRGRNAAYTDVESTESRVGLSQLLPTGAVVSLEATNDRVDVNDGRGNRTVFSPAIGQRAAIAIRQPLLKNMGRDITEANIRIARREQRISALQYEQQVIDRLADVMRGYWELVFAIENLKVQETSLEAALELERVNRVRVEAGAAANADLLQARARAAARRNSVIAAKSAILDAQDRLLRLLNWERKNTAQWARAIQPTDTPDRFDLEVVFDDLAFVEAAIARRPDFQAVLTRQEIAQIGRNVADWQRLPELNAIAEYSANATDDNTAGAFESVGARDHEGYFYGLEFRFPLINRKARGNYRAALGTLERANREIESAELGIITDVRAATRLLRTAQESIEASQAQVAAATETLEAERKRLEVGASTTFNVLDFQEKLAQAQVALLRAHIDYQLGLIALERSRGTLVDALSRDLGVEIVFETVEVEDDGAVNPLDERRRAEVAPGSARMTSP